MKLYHKTVLPLGTLVLIFAGYFCCITWLCFLREIPLETYKDLYGPSYAAEIELIKRYDEDEKISRREFKKIQGARNKRLRGDIRTKEEPDCTT